MNRAITMYVLAGTWETPDDLGIGVIAVSDNENELIGLLQKIAESRASEYVKIEGGVLKEDITDTHYEVAGNTSGNAKFYITEHYARISEATMGSISRAMHRIDLTTDVENQLDGLYESGNLEPWKWQYVTENYELKQKMVACFEKREDCNTSFNLTMEYAMEEVLKEVQLTDEVLENLWEQFGDVLIDDDECILDDFIGFDCGTHREEVWHWFDARHSKGVAWLLNGEE